MDLQKAASFLLTFLLLLSNMQLTFAQHYCGEEVVEASMMLGQRMMDCEASPTDSGCENEASKADDCCNNRYHQVQTDKDYAASQFSLDLDQDFMAVQPVQYRFLPSLDLVPKNIHFFLYPPPPLKKDIPVLYQTFRI